MSEFPDFNPNTRKPNVAPPPKSWDAQIHVFGDPARYPAASARIYDPPKGTFEDAQRMHRALGIEHAVIAQATIYGTDHRLLLDVLEGQKNYVGVAIIDDSVSDEELMRFHDAGVRGARFNFAKFLGIAPSAATFRRSIDRITELGWFVKIHADGEELVEHADLFQPLTIPVIIDHLGHLDFSKGFDQPGFALIMELLERDNWWMMISNGDRFSLQGFPWDDSIPFAQAFLEAAPDRTIWSTDWPHVRYRPKMPNDADLLELLYRCVPDAELRRKVLADNPARIFKLAD